LPELADVCNEVGIIDAGKMIASNDVATIIKQVQPNTVVLIQPIQANQLDAAAKVLQERNIVEAVQIANGLIRVHTKPRRGRLFRHSQVTPIERGTLFSKFAAEEINLESAFMAFTKGAGSAGLSLRFSTRKNAPATLTDRSFASLRAVVEICGLGGLMDWNTDFRRIGMEGLVLMINGADEAGDPRCENWLRMVWSRGRNLLRTGDAASPDVDDSSHAVHDCRRECMPVVATAHNHGMKPAGRSPASEHFRTPGR
jgi:hypothetical protein